jgi:FkbM family methyltransferase
VGEPEFKLLPLLVNPKRIAVDIGAHTGLYSVALQKLAKKVVALEPIPELASELTRLIPGAEVINAVASDSSGEVILRVPSGMPGLSTVSDRKFRPEYDIKEIKVKAITIDGLFENRSDDIGFIKIDVEGHEVQVLKGAKSVISRHRPVILIEAEERHSAGTVAEVFLFFQELNYSGLFLDGLLKSTKTFQLEIHQSLDGLDLSDLDKGRCNGRYINNFIFIPGNSP